MQQPLKTLTTSQVWVSKHSHKDVVSIEFGHLRLTTAIAPGESVIGALKAQAFAEITHWIDSSDPMRF